MRANHRLFEKDRIVDAPEHRHEQAVPEVVLGHHAVRARRRAVPLNDALLHVRGRHDELTVLPHAGGEAVPRVLGVFGRMRTAVHPHDAIGAAEAAGDRVRDQLLRDRIENRQDAERRLRSAHPVLRRMCLRLTLRLRQDRRIPRFGLLTIGGIDRQARIVAKLRTRATMRLVFVDDRRPIAGEMRADHWTACRRLGHHARIQHDKPGRRRATHRTTVSQPLLRWTRNIILLRNECSERKSRGIPGAGLSHK